MFSAIGNLFSSAESIQNQKQNEYLNNLKERLQADIGKKINPDELIQKLKDTHSCISGSYILQTIHNEKWEESDIDIFTNDINGNGQDMFNFLQNTLGNGKLKKKEYNEISQKNEYNEISQMPVMQGENRKLDLTMKSQEDYNKYDFVICKVYDFFVDQKIIQLIIMESKYYEHMDKVRPFDLDFCKVYFDGEKFTINEAALTKEGAVCAGRVPSIKTYDRIKKYEKRGFKVTNKTHVYEKLLGAYSYCFKKHGRIVNITLKNFKV